MSDKEATARIKINKLLESAGWRATSHTVRGIIESGHFTDLVTNPYFSTRDFTAVPARYLASSPATSRTTCP